MQSFKHINRYGDEIEFTPISDDTWEVSGFYSSSLRVGYPNDYHTAYGAYKVDEQDPLPLDQFIEEVLKTYPTKSHISERYLHLVTTDYSKIDMVDPSGGPYLHVGMYWKQLEGIVNEITLQPNKIILKVLK